MQRLDSPRLSRPVKHVEIDSIAGVQGTSNSRPHNQSMPSAQCPKRRVSLAWKHSYNADSRPRAQGVEAILPRLSSATPLGMDVEASRFGRNQGTFGLQRVMPGRHGARNNKPAYNIRPPVRRCWSLVLSRAKQATVRRQTYPDAMALSPELADATDFNDMPPRTNTA